jgi:hypothetical protein
MKKNLIGIILIVFVVSTGCGPMDSDRRSSATTIGSDAKAEATMTIYFPDGTNEAHVAYDVISYSESPITFWTDMDGNDHSTTLPTIVDYNHKPASENAEASN